jgi:hypothetical protein
MLVIITITTIIIMVMGYSIGRRYFKNATILIQTKYPTLFV